MFFLKKLLSRFLFPVPLCAGLLLLGLTLWSCTRWKKSGRACAWAGALALLLFAYPLLPDLALSQLETRFGPVAVDAEVGGERPAVSGTRYIMVLGQAISADTRRSAGARFTDQAVQRIVEGVRLYRQLTNATLLVSVSGPTVNTGQKEQAARELFAIFGMPTNGLRVCTSAWDTEDEIAWCREVAGTNRVLLVSSAAHLPWAMSSARRHGLDALACPSGYLVDPVTPRLRGPDRLLPDSANLQKTERAINGYLGLAWEWVRGARQPAGEEQPQRAE